MEPDDIEERVSALESQVGDLNRRVRSGEQDAQAARVLAGAADRDVADLGGEVRGMRADMRDFRREFNESRAEFQQHEGRFNSLTREVTGLRGEFNDFRRATMSSFNAQRADTNDGFAEMRAKFDVTAAGLQQVVGLIQQVIDDRGDNSAV